MYMQQRTTTVLPLSIRLQPLLAVLARIVAVARTDIADRRNAKLAPHFRYDVGEIDYDPDRVRSLDNPSSYESQLYLHHYPR